MSTSLTTDELLDLLKFPFNDERWVSKNGIGLLVLLAGYIFIIPLVFLYGYAAQIMRQIIVDGGSPYLPEWDDWGRLFTDGLKLIGVYLVYSLPLLLLFCGGYVVMIGAMAGTGALAGVSPEETSPLIGLLPVLGVFGWLACFGLTMLIGLAMGVVLPVALGHVIATDEFAAAFRFGEWWPIFRANLSGFIIAFVIVFGIAIVMNFAVQILYLTVVLCCLAPILLVVTGYYMLLIASVMFAQAYRDGVGKLAASA